MVEELRSLHAPGGMRSESRWETLIQMKQVKRWLNQTDVNEWPWRGNKTQVDHFYVWEDRIRPFTISSSLIQKQIHNIFLLLQNLLIMHFSRKGRSHSTAVFKLPQLESSRLHNVFFQTIDVSQRKKTILHSPLNKTEKVFNSLLHGSRNYIHCVIVYFHYRSYLISV